MNLRTALVFSLIVIQGCAVSTILQKSGEINIDDDRDLVILHIAKLAKQCWAKEYSFFGGDALRVEHLSYGITASRWAPDLDYANKQPIFRLRIMKNGTGSTVIMSEKKCDFLCSDRGLSSDVKRWLNDDNTCAKE